MAQHWRTSYSSSRTRMSSKWRCRVRVLISRCVDAQAPAPRAHSACARACVFARACLRARACVCTRACVGVRVRMCVCVWGVRICVCVWEGGGGKPVGRRWGVCVGGAWWGVHTRRPRTLSSHGMPCSGSVSASRRGCCDMQRTPCKRNAHRASCTLSMKAQLRITAPCAHRAAIAARLEAL